MKNSVDFCYFTRPFCRIKFQGTYSSIETLKGYMVRESLGTPVITQLFLLWGVVIAYVSPSYGHMYG